MTTQAFTLDDLLASHARMVADKDKRIAAALAMSTAYGVRNIEANSRHALHVAELEARINDLGNANRSLLYDIGELRIRLEDKNRAPCGVVLHDSPTVALKFTMAHEDWTDQKIPTIKLMRKLAGLGLKEAKDLVEGMTELRTHAAWLSEVRDNTGLTVQQWLDRVRDGYLTKTSKIQPVKFILNVTEGRIYECE